MNSDTMNKEQLLGTAPIPRLLLMMGIPSLLAQLVNLLYSMVDRIYIGHIPGCGADALTGMGLCTPLITMVSAFSFFVGAGGAPLAAIALGKGDRKKAEKILANGVTLLIIFSVILSVIIYTIKTPFLYKFGASDSTYPYANEYLSVYMFGTLFVLIATGLNTFITAQGQAKIAMTSVMIGAVTNIVLDSVFILGCQWGIKGAAIATVIAQAFSALWVVKFLLSKKATLRIIPSSMALDWKLVGTITALGVSPFIMQITESLIAVVFNSGMAKYGNDLYVGSITVLQTVMMIAFVPNNGFAQGAQPIISYNYGANNTKRVKQACKYIVGMATGYAFVISMIAILFPSVVAGIFTSDMEMIELCKKVMPIFMSGMLVFGIQTGCQQAFLALGQAKTSLFFALLRKVFLMVPLAILLPMITQSVISIYFAEAISDAVSAITCGMVFLVSLPKILNKNSL